MNLIEQIMDSMNASTVMVASTPTSRAYALRRWLEERYNSTKQRCIDGLMLSELDNPSYIGRTADVEGMELYTTPDGMVWGGYVDAFSDEPYLLPIGRCTDEIR